MIALIDCNNFFVSCERLFRPDLLRTPVVVLSSNDGCAVSRSNEVKALGMPMAGGIHQYRDLVEKHGIVTFSTNFELYGDISRRLTTFLTAITPAIEVYSIDEAFLDLSQLDIADYTAWGREVRARIAQEIGVPVSIGIAPSKTLAKLANHKAKKLPELEGVLHLDTHNTTPYLISTPVRDIWGIGRKLAPKLLVEGVATAYDLAHLRHRHARKLIGSIYGDIIVAELNGTMCLPLQQTHKPQKMIMRGRQFGADTRDWQVIEAAVATLGGNACLQLRREGGLATRAGVILRTNWRKPGYKTVVAFVQLREPTADTGAICGQLVRALQHKFTPRDYHKADVFLCDFVTPKTVQLDLFGRVNPQVINDQKSRMRALDSLNANYKPRTVHYAAEALSSAWKPRKNHASPRYTSTWSDLPEATVSKI